MRDHEATRQAPSRNPILATLFPHGELAGKTGRFDLAPPGAFWYPAGTGAATQVTVLISLPPKHSGIKIAAIATTPTTF